MQQFLMMLPGCCQSRLPDLVTEPVASEMIKVDFKHWSACVVFKSETIQHMKTIWTTDVQCSGSFTVSDRCWHPVSELSVKPDRQVKDG